MVGSVRLGISDDDLNAFVDGALDPIASLGVAAAVSVDPGQAERVRIYRAQNDGLKRLFGAVLDEPLPDRIATLIAAARLKPRLCCAC